MQAARESWDGAIRARREARLPQRSDHGARTDRHDRVPDGLRYDRHRARHRDRQVQAAGRRRSAQDRQPHGAGVAEQARLHGERGRGDRRAHQHARHHRRRAAPQGRAPAGVRLRVPGVEWHALDPLHGPHPDDGGGPAVPLGCDLEDGEPADRLHGRRHRGRVHQGVADGPQGDRGLPRWLQAHPAAVDQHGAGHVRTARASRSITRRSARSISRRSRRRRMRRRKAPRSSSTRAPAT